MNRIVRYLLLVFVLPLSMVACSDDDDNNTGFPQTPSGTYFSMMLDGANYWSGANQGVLRATRQPDSAQSKYYDFVVISNSESDSVLQNYLYLHANVNSDGTLSNYVLRYFKDIHTYDTGFGQYYTRTSGSMSIKDTSNGKITATFNGILTNNVTSVASNVELYFQQVPIKVAPNKKK